MGEYADRVRDWFHEVTWQEWLTIVGEILIIIVFVVDFIRPPGCPQ